VGETRTAARPRLEGERAREVLQATLRLLAEVGYDKLTFDEVATRAHAGKASLYRRWSSKAELVADAMGALHGEELQPDTGNLHDDLHALVELRRSVSDGDVRLMCGVSTAMSTDPELNRALRERFVEPKRAMVRRILEAARARGEIGEHIDVDLVATLIPAMMTFWSVVEGTPPPAELAERVIDELVLPAVRRCPGTSPGPDDG
jgi:AcrR family transcriptional regulator